MGKKKLKLYSIIKTFHNVLEFPIEKDFLNKCFYLKSKWNKEFFKNENQIILELACGKGEYSIGMGEKYPKKNFIGVDIKGARICQGALISLEKKLKNVCFLRTTIERIENVFSKNEINEIWITFPDPQIKKPKKRLTYTRFLNYYKTFLSKNGTINLKTDNKIFYEFTLEMIKINKLNLIYQTEDLYNTENLKFLEILKEIQTYYEKKFLKENKNIFYIKFSF